MPQPTRFAFAGLRHSHVLSLIRAVDERSDTTRVAICEEDSATRDQIAQANKLDITHTSIAAMLEDVDCDVVVVGEAYGRRGALAQQILKSGRHVLSDKPLCTSLAELDAIARLASDTGLSVGCMLDLRDAAPFITLRRLIQEDAIGQVQTVTFLAQHPLNRTTRPAWYFEPGLHGGTINDIMIHAFDGIPWVTGRQLMDVVAARAWHACAPDAPNFQDGAQVMLRLDNGGGVLGDASYLGPDALGYGIDQYWRFTIHGSKGMIETHYTADHVTLARSGEKAVQSIALNPGRPDGYLDDFLSELAGSPHPHGLTTAGVLAVSRFALKAQAHADKR